MNMEVRSFRIGWMMVLAARALAATDLPACVPVRAGPVLASDLLASIPELSALDPGLVIARPPELGIRRIISARELNRIMRIHAPRARAVDPGKSVCVVRTARKLDESEIRTAVRSALRSQGAGAGTRMSTGSGRDLTVEILDFAMREVDEGELSFPLQTLSRPLDPATAVIWRGWHNGLAGRKVPVWVKFRAFEQVVTPHATREIRAGETIVSAAIEFREGLRFPDSTQSLPVDPVGKIAKRTIQKDGEVSSRDLEAELAVRRGDPVEVQVSVGAVTLKKDGKAETSGQPGQRVAVSSALSKRVFQAVVKEKGHVLVHFDPTSDPVKTGPVATPSATGVRRLP